MVLVAGYHYLITNDFTDTMAYLNPILDIMNIVLTNMLVMAVMAVVYTLLSYELCFYFTI